MIAPCRQREGEGAGAAADIEDRLARWMAGETQEGGGQRVAEPAHELFVALRIDGIVVVRHLVLRSTSTSDRVGCCPGFFAGMRIRDVRIFASPTENASRPFHRCVGSSRGGAARICKHADALSWLLAFRCWNKSGTISSAGLALPLQMLGSSPKCPRVRGVW